MFQFTARCYSVLQFLQRGSVFLFVPFSLPTLGTLKAVFTCKMCRDWILNMQPVTVRGFSVRNGCQGALLSAGWGHLQICRSMCASDHALEPVEHGLLCCRTVGLGFLVQVASCTRCVSAGGGSSDGFLKGWKNWSSGKGWVSSLPSPGHSWWKRARSTTGLGLAMRVGKYQQSQRSWWIAWSSCSIAASRTRHLFSLPARN